MKTDLKPLLLLLAIISASLFMVVESGEYYSTFYKNPYQGYWAAFLVEGFLAIAAMLYVAEKRVLNFCIKVVMIPLFLVVVGGASLKVVSPMMKELAKIQTQRRLVDLLEEQNEQSSSHLALLQGQKINTALVIQHQRQVSNQLVGELQKQSSSPWMIWIVIGFSTFLRLSVQLANLVFAHSFGVLWKNRNKTATQLKVECKSKMRKSSLQINQEKVIRYLVKNDRQATRSQILSSKILNDAKEYDKILSRLEKAGKIAVDRQNTLKQAWVYLIV